MVTRWRFLLPVVMVLFFAATLGYREVRDWTRRAENATTSGWDPVSVWDGDLIEEGLFAFQAVGLIPAALLMGYFALPLDGWWTYLAEFVSISCVWFVIGLVIDLIKKRSKLQPLRLQ